MAATEDLLKIAARIVFQQVATPYRLALERRIIGAAVCGALGLIALLGAVACGVGAFWLWLAPKLGPTEAALVTMGALLVIAAIFALIATRLARRAPTKALRDVLGDRELGLGQLNGIGKLLEGHIPELMAAAAVGGLLFGLRRRK